MLYNYVVYIEQSIAEHPNTLYILQKIKCNNIIYIKHYKDVFNQSSSQWRIQKNSQKIILAERQNNFYYLGSDVTPNFGFDNFYYNTLALNCLYDCDYCYLQGLFSSAHMVLFVNNETYIEETKKLLAQLQKPTYLALSYDTDLLAIANWYNYCEDWIKLCAKQKKLTIEIRTKSANINALKNSIPQENVILAWTLSPEEVIAKHEKNTPSLKARIAAIKKAQQAGWQVRLCFDPILKINDWKSVYQNCIQEVITEIDFKKLNSISIGVFRMNKEFLKQIQHQRNDNTLLFDQYELNNDTYTYQQELKNEMIHFIKNRLSAHHANIELI